MSRFKAKQDLIDDIVKERRKLEALLAEIPDEHKTAEVTEGMSIKDFLAHRTEWGRMMIQWYKAAKAGTVPAVPSEKYKWNQLKELNAEIFERFKDDALDDVVAQFGAVHDELFAIIEGTDDNELFTKKYYEFTGSSDLVAYFNSATAAHYRSATKHIKKWWKSRNA